MRTAIMALGAAALLLAGSLRLRAQLRAPHPGATYLGAAGLAAGFALLLNAPTVYRWGDRSVFHDPNASALASYLLTVVGIGAALEMVTTLVSTPCTATRWARRAAAAGVAAAMVAIFAIAAPSREDPLFFEHYRQDPRLVIFWILFCGSGATAITRIAVLVRRVARHDDRYVASGLRLIASGAGCVSVFFLGCLVQVAIPAIPAQADTLAEAILVTGGFLLAMGMLWPQLATKAQRAAACRRLRPLWATVTARYPYVRSPARRPNLYRTVIEIEDAVAEARVHRQVDTPLLQALDALTAHSAERFDGIVSDLLQLAATSTEAGPITAFAGIVRRSVR